MGKDKITLPPLHYDELPEPDDPIPAMQEYARKAIKADRKRWGEPVSKTYWNNELSSWSDEDFIRIFHERPDLAKRLRKMLADPVKVPSDEEIQALKRDAERIEWLEAQTKKSYTGISFDYHRYVEDGYVVDHGYRFMRRHFASGFMDSLRKAIDAAMEDQNEHTRQD